MSIFIVGPSALEAWRAASSPTQYPPTKVLPQKDRYTKSDPPSEFDLMAIGICSQPVHCAVESANQRGQASWQISHVMSSLPAGSFRRIQEGLYVASPEAVFLQMASPLSVAQLTLLAYELCGSYSTDPLSSRGFRQRNPLTSIEAIVRYLDNSKGIKGVKKARRAIEFARNGSASPMESIIALLLCLPCSMGGYGIPLPVLNERVEIDSRVKGLTDRKFFKCDLFWPQARLALEYDSELEHTAAERIFNDAKKRNVLEAMGYRVLTVTKPQVYDAREFEQIATLISKRLKRYKKSAQSMALSRRHILRQEILYGATPEKVAFLKKQLKNAQGRGPHEWL